MDCKKALKTGTIASKNSILVLTIAAVMLVGGMVAMISVSDVDARCKKPGCHVGANGANGANGGAGGTTRGSDGGNGRAGDPIPGVPCGPHGAGC